MRSCAVSWALLLVLALAGIQPALSGCPGRKPGVFRVLAVGDSLTWGSGESRAASLLPVPAFPHCSTAPHAGACSPQLGNKLPIHMDPAASDGAPAEML